MRGRANMKRARAIPREGTEALPYNYLSDGRAHPAARRGRRTLRVYSQHFSPTTRFFILTFSVSYPCRFTIIFYCKPTRIGGR